MSRTTALVVVSGVGLTASLMAMSHAPASNGPTRPSSDDEVVCTLPPRAPAATAPLSADAATARAYELMAEARRQGGDMRLLGRAQATLAPWWGQTAVPTPLRLVRATLKQSLHDFPGALTDLDVVVMEDPANAQAWLTRATVLNVLARADEALASCAHLDGLASAVVAGVCRSQTLALQGHADEALALMEQLSHTPMTRDEAAWLWSVRGELERFAGDDRAAEASLTHAHALDPRDTYTRLLLGQLWLDSGRPEKTAALFGEQPMNDAELLQEVLGLGATQAPSFAARRGELEDRVEANRQRGETLHRREESTYALAVEGDVSHALELAVANWAVQRELADARVLLEAAVAAHDPKAAEPALRWLDATGCRATQVVALAQELRR